MQAINVAAASMAGLALVVGLFAHALRRHWINEPLLALLLGVLIGPAGLGWLDLDKHGDPRTIIEVAARFTLAAALVSVGLSLRSFLSRNLRSLTVLVMGGTVLMWGASSLLLGWVLRLEPLPALLIGAVLAPTDPILTAAVATGRVARENLPARILHLLAGESAARHGLSLIWVLMPAALLTRPDHEAWTHWLTAVVLWKGLGAVIIGVAIGYVVGRTQRWSGVRGYTAGATGPLVALFPSLSLMVVSVVELLRIDGLLAVLVAGVAYAWARTGEDAGEDLKHEQRHYEELLKQVLQVPVFVLLGVALPWGEWGKLGWRAAALVVAVLLLRRIPAVLLLKPLVGQLRRWDEALFMGWFGPAGVGALYLAAVAHKETQIEAVWPVMTLLVAASIVAHDLTATPLIRWLARRDVGAPAAEGE